jgi:hypothetical protein
MYKMDNNKAQEKSQEKVWQLKLKLKVGFDFNTQAMIHLEPNFSILF